MRDELATQRLAATIETRHTSAARVAAISGRRRAARSNDGPGTPRVPPPSQDGSGTKSVRRPCRVSRLSLSLSLSTHTHTAVAPFLVSPWFLDLDHVNKTIDPTSLALGACRNVEAATMRWGQRSRGCIVAGAPNPPNSTPPTGCAAADKPHGGASCAVGLVARHSSGPIPGFRPRCSRPLRARAGRGAIWGDPPTARTQALLPPLTEHRRWSSAQQKEEGRYVSVQLSVA